MPFPGILAGSELEQKIDRCVLRVMKTGRDKSAAIAICRSAIPGASSKVVGKYKDHSGAMISLTVPAGIAQGFALDTEGALPASEMHITLAYLGKAADLSSQQVRNIHGAVEGLSFGYTSLQGAINGVGRFCNSDPDGDAFFIIPDIPQLPALRQDLIERLENKGIPTTQNHGFVPHITLMYLPHKSPNPFSQVEREEGLVFPSISFSLAGEKFDYPFRVETTKSKQDAIEQANYRSAGPASTQICGTCKFGANSERHCSLFEFAYRNEDTCDRWLPNIEASRERLQQLQTENKARLGKRKEWVNEAKVRLGWIYPRGNNA
jgi:2'-5' RNA ligase